MRKGNLYERYWKRLLDILLSFIGMLALSWLFLLIALLIKLEDAGPAFFRQKRYGKNKEFFNLHKFRSMKMNAPKDVPTHLLSHPEAYVTKVGILLRKSSLDELPQLLDVFRGKMSIIGPRPALWNQEDLIAERDRYQANGVLPGLTGWAQINGRDSISISQKARLDGEYVKALRFGGWKAFLCDCRCFFLTFACVLTAKGFSEGKHADSGQKEDKGALQ